MLLTTDREKGAGGGGEGAVKEKERERVRDVEFVSCHHRGGVGIPHLLLAMRERVTLKRLSEG